MNTIEKKLAPLGRPAWFPRVEEGDGEPSVSKLSGLPYLPPGEKWPECPHCHQPMQLFVQLNLADLPPSFKSSFRLDNGLLQFFYCTSFKPPCEIECHANAPFAESEVVRVISLEGSTAPVHAPDIPRYFPAKRIVGWEEVRDYPDWYEAIELGVQLRDEELDAFIELHVPRQGEKLGGWPFWRQSVAYPSCPQCGSAMRMVFQVDSDVNFPYTFSDAGIGHIMQCPTHKEILTFEWDCG